MQVLQGNAHLGPLARSGMLPRIARGPASITISGAVMNRQGGPPVLSSGSTALLDFLRN